MANLLTYVSILVQRHDRKARKASEKTKTNQYK